jgi:DNA-binding response OmpR family regulator
MPRGEDFRRAAAVLVVDDDDGIRSALADVVEDSGRRAFTARDGGDALRKLDTDSIPRPCLILLDWIMSPVGGEEFLRKLKARGDADQLPVLVMSANTTVGAGTIIPGVLGTLQKPFGVRDLLRILDQYC